MSSRERPNWDETFMEVAGAFAKRSTCVFYKVGVCFVRNKQLLAVGYNGPPSGVEHCDEIGCAKIDKATGQKLPAASGRCMGNHAEMNAVMNNSFVGGPSLEGAVVYTTCRPCRECFKHLQQLKIEKVIFLNEYDGDNDVGDMARKAGIPLIKLNEKEK